MHLVDDVNRPRVALVLPVYNEEEQLESSVTTIWERARFWPDFSLTVIVADNGSDDATPTIAAKLANEGLVKHVQIREKGRGGALKRCWLQADADILAYMDIDLSTDLDFFPELVREIQANNADIVIGSRLLRPDWTNRGWKRQILSRGYSLLLALAFSPPFKDAQCGFKALSRKAALNLLPHVRNNSWFFDTEMLVLASRHRYRILEVPVRWRDDPDSRVRIIHTIVEDLVWIVKLAIRLRKQHCAHQTASCTLETVQR